MHFIFITFSSSNSIYFGSFHRIYTFETEITRFPCPHLIAKNIKKSLQVLDLETVYVYGEGRGEKINVLPQYVTWTQTCNDGNIHEIIILLETVRMVEM